MKNLSKLCTGIFFLLLSNFSLLAQEGYLDFTYDSEIGPNGVVTQIIELNDGNNLVCGSYNRFGTKSQSSVTWVNDIAKRRDTILTPFVITKQGLSKTPITKVIEQADGKILIFNCMPEPRIHRYNSDGTKDETFNPGKGMLAGGNKIIDAILQKDGKILLIGTFNSIDGKEFTQHLARLNKNGSVDENFKKGWTFKTGHPECIAVQNDGKILIGGQFMKIRENGQNTHEFHMARLNEDGSIDKEIETEGEVRKMALQNDGKIVIAVQSGSNTYDKLFLHRLNSDGKKDSTFTTWQIKKGNLDVFVYDLCIQPDNKIIVGGSFVQRSTGGPNHDQQIDSAFNLFRLLADGKNDTSFYMNSHRSYYPNASVNSIYYTSKGQILIGGAFLKIGDTPRKYFARLNGDGKGTNSILNSRKNMDINIYPNPSSNIIYVESELQLGQLKIHDVRGQLIFNANKWNDQIDIFHLKQGVYYLSIETQNGIGRSTFIKK